MKRFLLFFSIALFISFLVASAVMVFPAYHNNKNLTRENLETRRKLIEKQREYMQLRQTLSNINSRTEEVEKIAREKFNFCREGETVYKFEPAPAPTGK